MEKSRKKLAITVIATLVVSVGLTYLLGFLLVMGGLGGAKLDKFGPIQILFIITFITGVLSYVLIVLNTVHKIYRYKLAGLILSERISIIFLIIAYPSISSAIKLILVIEI